MRWARWFLGLLIFVPLGEAVAAPDVWAVVATVTGDPPPGLDAARVEAMVHTASRLRPDLQVLRSEELFVRAADAQRRLTDCGSDVACAAQRLQGLGLDGALFVLVSVESAESFVDLRLIRAAASASPQAASQFVSSTGRAIEERVFEDTARLLDAAGYRQVGRLDVEVRPSTARVQIQGPVSSRAGPRHVLDPGTYTVIVTADEYRTERRTVRIAAGQAQRLQVELTEVAPALYARPWFWGVVGAVALGAATAAVVASRSGGPPCFCVTAAGRACQACP